MTKSELISILASESTNLPGRDVELAIKCILEQMSQALAANKRIEIRGFGSFSLHFRPPRMGRNPKTGEAVSLDGKYVPHFKPGKDLRERVNNSFQFPNSESANTVSRSQSNSNNVISKPHARNRARIRNRARVRPGIT